MQDHILVELQYFPSIQYFSKLLAYKKVEIEQHENYTKRSYRNRCHIASANGLQRLSIPLAKGKNESQNIRAVKIANDENWQSKHWTAIQSAYGSAPFFEFYADEIRPFFEEKQTFLFDYNIKILACLLDLLGMAVNWQLTAAYDKNPSEALDFRNQISPKINPKNDANFQSPVYGQVFEEKLGFIENLSILDLLFCKGPESILLLEESYTEL